jgi:hypothetical protein
MECSFNLSGRSGAILSGPASLKGQHLARLHQRHWMGLSGRICEFPDGLWPRKVEVLAPYLAPQIMNIILFSDRRMRPFRINSSPKDLALGRWLPSGD